MAKTSWIGTDVEWARVICRGLSLSECHAAVLPFRQQRLPWLGLKKLLVVIDNNKLMIYKHESLPQGKLAPTGQILELSPAELTLKAIDEFFTWPTSEAIYNKFAKSDLVEFQTRCWLTAGVMKKFHAKPLPGWWAVDRGALGVSFLRDAAAGCMEVTATGLVLYRGSIAENEGLRDHRIIRRWPLHSMEINNLSDIITDVEDMVQARLMQRMYRVYLWDFVLENELPF